MDVGLGGVVVEEVNAHLVLATNAPNDRRGLRRRVVRATRPENVALFQLQRHHAHAPLVVKVEVLSRDVAA